MKHRFWKFVLSIGALLLALTLSIALQLKLPKPGGPYAVGRTIFRWVDTSRPEVLTADPNDSREVMALVWYPAMSGTGTKVGYIPNFAALSAELANSGELEPWEVFGLRFIRSKNHLDAEPVKNQGLFPVVLLRVTYSFRCIKKSSSPIRIQFVLWVSKTPTASWLNKLRQISTLASVK